MKATGSLLPLVCAAALLTASVPALAGPLSAEDTTALIATHGAATSKVSKAPQSVDWTAYVDALYAPDAKVLAPSMAAISGREALIEFYASLPRLTEFAMEVEEAGGSGDMAFVRGSYRLTMQADENARPKPEVGKFLQVWQRRNGVWRCTHDMFNTSPKPEPAPAPAPAG